MPQHKREEGSESVCTKTSGAHGFHMRNLESHGMRKTCRSRQRVAKSALTLCWRCRSRPCTVGKLYIQSAAGVRQSGHYLQRWRALITHAAITLSMDGSYMTELRNGWTGGAYLPKESLNFEFNHARKCSRRALFGLAIDQEPVSLKKI